MLIQIKLINLAKSWLVYGKLDQSQTLMHFSNGGVVRKEAQKIELFIIPLSTS